jgi:hypothetical protein
MNQHLKLAYDYGAQQAIADLEKLAVFKVPLKEMLKSEFGPAAYSSKIQRILKGNVGKNLSEMPLARRQSMILAPEHPMYGMARDSRYLAGELSPPSFYTNLRNKKNLTLDDLAGASPKDLQLLNDFTKNWKGSNVSYGDQSARYSDQRIRDYFLG